MVLSLTLPVLSAALFCHSFSISCLSRLTGTFLYWPYYSPSQLVQLWRSTCSINLHLYCSCTTAVIYRHLKLISCRHFRCFFSTCNHKALTSAFYYSPFIFQ